MQFAAWHSCIPTWRVHKSAWCCALSPKTHRRRPALLYATAVPRSRGGRYLLHHRELHVLDRSTLGDVFSSGQNVSTMHSSVLFT